MSEIELSIKIDGREVFKTNGSEWLTCGNEDKEIVLSALSESMVMICGCLPKPDLDTTISHHRHQTPVLTIIPRGDQ